MLAALAFLKMACRMAGLLLEAVLLLTVAQAQSIAGWRIVGDALC